MITKAELTDAMVAELRICKRLFKKIPKSKYGYRPAKTMRSTEELLRYLSFCGTECARAIILDAFKTNKWDDYVVAEKKAQEMKLSRFPAAIDQQIKDLTKLIAGIPEREFAKRVIHMPGRKKMPLGQAIAFSAGRFVCGYRMQLFLYARACGAKLDTMDCWFKV